MSDLDERPAQRRWAPSDWIAAPAKLTVSFRVVGVRSDGYHEVESEMVTLDLADSLLFEEGEGLSISGSLATWTGDIPLGQDNLVSRALAAVERTAAVRLVKRIPAGAGLGGGSADAAAVLRWAGCHDAGLAVRLGSDVPFCVIGGRARVSGIGELVDPLPFEDRRFVLLLPPFGVDTTAVYRMWDDLDARGHAGVTSGGCNDLEEAALAVEPRLADWRELFGAVTGRSPSLAGSGSTWFVEGSPGDVGLDGRAFLEREGLRAPLVAVRTVPAPAAAGTRSPTSA